MNSQIKIVHIIESLTTGGAEMLLCNFIKHYKKEQPGSKHYIITLRNRLELLAQINDKIEEIDVIPFTKVKSIQALKRLRERLKQISPDLIHTHLFYSTILGRLAAGKNIPVISTYHNMEYCKESPNYSFKYIWIDRLTYSSVRNFPIYVSQAVKNCVQNAVPSQKSNGLIVSNFVTDDFRKNYIFKDNNSLNLVAVGNLKKVKNHLFALQEMATINNENISLDIYGEGNEYDNLNSYIKENGLLNVTLKGTVVISSELLGKYDAFLMPSISEGMPVSLIEAIVSGMPSLVSDLPQLRETAGEAALYFSPVKKGALSALLKSVCRDKSVLMTLSNEAERLAPQYGWPRYYYAIQAVYKKALSSIRLS